MSYLCAIYESGEHPKCPSCNCQQEYRAHAYSGGVPEECPFCGKKFKVEALDNGNFLFKSAEE